MENVLPATLTIWITQYGSLALFVLLALGIFALPIPDETLLLFVGVLIAHQQLMPLPSFIAAVSGSIAGISISYIIGRTAGNFFIRRYGHWIGLTEERMQRVHGWFERIGRWSLFIGYFIPGIRQVTGYAAGITALSYRQFALFAYPGAVIWVTLFLSLGYFVGDRWDKIESFLYQHWPYLAGVGGAIIIFIIGYVWVCKVRRSKKQI